MLPAGRTASQAPYQPSRGGFTASVVTHEGRWSTGAGVPAAECREIVLRHRDRATVKTLADPALWGRVVDDERYLVVSSGTEMAA